MGVERIPPHDVAAEEALIGACLLSSTVIQEALEVVLPEDFYKPGHQFIWDSIRQLWNTGQPIDALTVASALREAQVLEDIGGPGVLMDLQGATPAISHAKAYAASVVKCSRLRSAISAASEVLDLVYDKGDPDEVIDLLGALVSDKRLIPRKLGLPEDLSTVGEFLSWYADQHPDEESEWLVPQMFRRRHRVLFVGVEGGGKSTAIRQILHLLADGRHPWSPQRRITPRRVLIVDCENPDDAIVEQTMLIDRRAGLPISQSPNLWLWRCEQGMDLRKKRTDQARFEEVLKTVRPECVYLGPVYKIYSNDRDLELSALELFAVLDSFRKRYDFALIMEHHAPKGSSGVRELSPFGTVAWQRWPEFGVQLKPENFDEHHHPHTLKVARFRGDRLSSVVWPTHLQRSSGQDQVPWQALMPSGFWHGVQGEDPNVEPPAPPPPDDDDW